MALATVRSRRSWYDIRALIPATTATAATAAVQDVTDILIYDEVGAAGVKAAQFATELRTIGTGRINLHLNSPGGEVFGGVAIYNALRQHPAEVHVYVDGIAASIASVIAMAGQTVTMEPSAQMMIHDGHAVCVGAADDMRQLADVLDRCSDVIAGIYAERAGGSAPEWRARMKATTWFNAREALAARLVDEIAGTPAVGGAPRATWDVASIFGRTATGDGQDETADVVETVELDDDWSRRIEQMFSSTSVSGVDPLARLRGM